VYSYGFHERKNGNTIQESILIHNFEGRGGLHEKVPFDSESGAAALVPVGVSRAQLAAANETGVTMGHVHLVVQDVEAGKKFWLAMGATPMKLGANEVMKFPGVFIFLRKGEPSGAPLDRW